MPAQSIAGFAQRAFVVLALIAAALFAWAAVDVLLLVFGAVLLATAFRALADAIAAWTPLTGRWALAVSVTAVVAVLALAGWLFGSEVRSQIDQLVRTLPAGWEELQKRLSGNGWFNAVEDRLSSASGGMANLVSSARWAATSLLVIVVNFLLISFGGLYIAAQPALYRGGMLALFAPSIRDRARDTFDACAGALRLWLLGQIVSMVVVGVLTGVGLWLVGLPSALALGVLAGLAVFVPIVGPILAAVPGLLLALPQGLEMTLWVLGVYVAVQQVESNVLMPIVQRKAVLLPPALTLFAVVAMGAVLGPLGLLFATPLTVVAYVLVKKLYIVETLHEETKIPGEHSGP